MDEFVWKFSKCNTQLFHTFLKKFAFHFGGPQIIKQISMKLKIPSSVYSSTLLILSSN